VPAVILSLSAIVNIVLDPLLIFGLWGFPRLELQGAAIATVLANAVTVVASLTILYRRERMIRWRYVNVDDLWDSWRRLLHIAIPATATNLLLPVTFAAITAMVAGYGPEAVAGFAVASRLESVVLIVIFAVQASVGPVVGQNYGAGLLDRVRDAISLSNRFLLIYSLVFAVILFMFARPMAELFDENPVVVETATAYLRIVPFTYGAFGVMMISLGGFNSLGRPMPPAILTFVKFVIIYLPLAWVLTRSIGITGIFWANAVSHVLLGIASAIWLRKALVSLEAEDRLTRPLASVNVAPTPESSS
jgi:putative MATE family efflux protein